MMGLESELNENLWKKWKNINKNARVEILQQVGAQDTFGTPIQIVFDQSE